jgi:DNA-binding NtrC family response regulator
MNIHILIVEAENRFRKDLYKRLQLEGFVVDKVTYKDDVVDIITKEKIDTIIIGIDGLGREGLALIEPIKQARPASKIIIINDYRHIDLSIKGMELGAYDDFLVPLNVDSLAARIREAYL